MVVESVCLENEAWSTVISYASFNGTSSELFFLPQDFRVLVPNNLPMKTYTYRMKMTVTEKKGKYSASSTKTSNHFHELFLKDSCYQLSRIMCWYFYCNREISKSSLFTCACSYFFCTCTNFCFTYGINLSHPCNKRREGKGTVMKVLRMILMNCKQPELSTFFTCNKTATFLETRQQLMK